MKKLDITKSILFNKTKNVKKPHNLKSKIAKLFVVGTFVASVYTGVDIALPRNVDIDTQSLTETSKSQNYDLELQKIYDKHNLNNFDIDYVNKVYNEHKANQTANIFLNQEFIELPSDETVRNNLTLMGIDDTILSKTNPELSRFSINKNNPVIRVGIVTDGMTEKEIQAIKESIALVNDAFKVINPEYSFSIVINPTNKDLSKPDFISVKVCEDACPDMNSEIACEYSFNVLGQNDGTTSIYNRIYMGKESRNTINRFRLTFLHEFMHSLGLDDAYDKNNFYEKTLMQSATDNGKIVSMFKYDLKVLACLYADLSDEQTLQRINNYIDNYDFNDTSLLKEIFGLNNSKVKIFKKKLDKSITTQENENTIQF